MAAPFGKPEEYDVIIIGSGPAGSTTALELGRLGYSVVLVEAMEDNRWKVGECLPPVTKRLLISLKLWEDFLKDHHRPCYGICSAWGSADLYHQSFIFDPYGNGWHLDRKRFDEMLARNAATAGATRRFGSVVSCARTAINGWQIELQSPEGQQSRLLTKFAVDATGRRSWLARRQGARRISFDRLVSLVSLIETTETTGLDSLITVEATEHGWWYAARLPDERLVVALMVDSDLQPIRAARVHDFWRAQLCQTIHIRRFIESNSYEVVSVSPIIAANSSCLNVASGHSWLAVGDAAAAYDPISSQGILTAMEMAGSASTAIDRYLKGDAQGLEDYAAAVRSKFIQYLANLRFYYEMEQRWPQASFWQRRSSSWYMPTIWGG